MKDLNIIGLALECKDITQDIDTITLNLLEDSSITLTPEGLTYSGSGIRIIMDPTHPCYEKIYNKTTCVLKI